MNFWRKVDLPLSTWLIIAVVMLAVIWPYFWAVITAHGDFYTGVNAWAGADKPVYLSQIEQARQGHVLFKNLYSTEQQGYAQLAPVWLALGWLGSLTTLSNVAVFNLGRILAAFIFLIVLAQFLKQLFSTVRWRNIALLVATLSSGLGVLTWRPFTEEIATSGWFGTDLWVSESNTFLTMWHSALFILSQLAVLLIFWWLADGWLKTRSRQIWAGVILLLLGITHPYDLILIVAVAVCWWVYLLISNQNDGWQTLKRSWLMVVGSAIATAYTLWLFISQPAFLDWAEQNVTLSPAIWNYVIGYGLLVPLAIYGAVLAWRSRQPLPRFLVFWLVIQWFLLFMPLQFQRRLSSGLHLVMASLAVYGLYYLWQFKLDKIKNYILKNASKIIVVLVLVVGLTMTIGYYLTADWLVTALHPARIYLSQPEYQVMVWLKHNQTDQDIVLSNEVTGNTLPSITGKLVYVGHGHQTSNAIAKFWYVDHVFFGTNNQDQLKEQFLRDNHIKYIYYGPNEQKQGDFKPEEKPYLIKNFSAGSVAVYEVR